MAFKIYTKTGDEGQTGLFGGKRLPKHHLRIEAYGTVDELNAYLGLLRDHSSDEAVRAELLQIQERLFALGAQLAADPDKEFQLPGLLPEDVAFLEARIDAMDAQLPPLRNFILPGGHPVVSHSHVARCVCRRAERLGTALAAEEGVPPLVLPYLNRLSDYLFTLARYHSHLLGVAEIPWVPRG